MSKANVEVTFPLWKRMSIGRSFVPMKYFLTGASWCQIKRLVVLESIFRVSDSRPPDSYRDDSGLYLNL